MNQETELYRKFFGKEPKTSEVDFGYEGYDQDDVINQRLDHKNLSSLRDSNLKKAMMGINSLTDPTSMSWALPNEGLFGGLKALAGGASALVGSGLGYAKVFSKDKEQTNLYNKKLGDDGYKDDVLKKRNSPKMVDGGELPFGKWLEQNPSVGGLDETMQRKLYDASMKNSGMSINNDLYNLDLPNNTNNNSQGYTLPPGFNPKGRDISADGKSNLTIPKLNDPYEKKHQIETNDTVDGLDDLILDDIPSGNANEGGNFNSSTITHQGDPLGQLMATNSLYGLSMASNFFKQRSLESDYNEMKRNLGNSHNRFQEQDMVDAFGNYTVNSGVGNNFKLNKMVSPQSLGSTYYKKGGDTSAGKKKSINYISKEEGGDLDGDPLKNKSKIISSQEANDMMNYLKSGAYKKPLTAEEKKKIEEKNATAIQNFQQKNFDNNEPLISKSLKEINSSNTLDNTAYEMYKDTPSIAYNKPYLKDTKVEDAFLVDKNSGFNQFFVDEDIKYESEDIDISTFDGILTDEMFQNQTDLDPNNICWGGNCKQSADYYYNKFLANNKGFPSTYSMTPMSEKYIDEWAKGDTEFQSVDTWDVAELLHRQGATTYYNSMNPDDGEANSLKNLNKAPIGTYVLWGPKGNKSDKSSRNTGMSYKDGKGNYPASHHTMIIAGYNKDGEAILYDGFLGKKGTLKEMQDRWSKYVPQVIISGKGTENNTFEKLQKGSSESTKYTPLNLDGIINESNKDFLTPLISYKKDLISELGITNQEYDELAAAVVSLGKNESDFGNSQAAKFKDITGLGETVGITSINYEINIEDNYKLRYQLNSIFPDFKKSDLKDPEKSAIATLLLLNNQKHIIESMYKEGKTPGSIDYRKEDFTKRLVRESGSTVNDDGVYLEEVNKRIDINGLSPEQATKKLNELSGTQNYSVKSEGLLGELVVTKKESGNSVLTFGEAADYYWRNPIFLRKGAAQGNSSRSINSVNYYKDIMSKQPYSGRNNLKYKVGGEYELPEKEIQKMIDEGYEFEYID